MSIDTSHYLVKSFLSGDLSLISESSMSRIIQHIVDPTSTFGQISAFRKQYSLDENNERHAKLKSAIRKLGLGFIEMAGGFKEPDGTVQELSLFVPNITKSDVVSLGMQYKQYSVLWKDPSQFVEIGTLDSSNLGHVLNSFHTTGSVLDLDTQSIKDFWSSLYKGSHKQKKFLFIMERRDASWWTEWRLSREQDDTELWFRIV